MQMLKEIRRVFIVGMTGNSETGKEAGYSWFRSGILLEWLVLKRVRWET
jgi:hypothetical protein